jgi:internalin A
MVERDGIWGGLGLFRAAMWCLVPVLLCGCGLPTWSELIGAKKDEQQPVVVPVPPRPSDLQPSPTPPPPPPPSPAEVIAAFQAKPSYEIDDDALATLLSLPEGLEELRVLNLNGSKVTPRGLKEIGRATNLAKLDLRNTMFDENMAEAVAAATAVEELRLDGPKLTDQSLAAMRPLKQLRVLECNQVRLSTQGWIDMLNHPELEELQIRQSNINDEALSYLSKCPRLRRLNMYGTTVTDVGLAQLGRLEALEFLNVTQCPIRGVGFRGVGGGSGKGAFLALQDLTMQGCPLNEQGAAVISQMKQLRALNLGDMPTMRDQDCIRMIRPLKELQSLHLVNNIGLTGNALQALQGNESIERIRLDGCTGINDAGLRFLVKCTNLRELNLPGTACTVNGANALKQALPGVNITGIGQN